MAVVEHRNRAATEMNVWVDFIVEDLPVKDIV